MRFYPFNHLFVGKPTCCQFCAKQSKQGGFLLLGLMVFIVVVTTAFVSFVQYQDQNRRWQSYYAFGQQLATAAQAMHLEVQTDAFVNSNPLPNGRFDDGNSHLWDVTALESKLGIAPITMLQYGLDYRNTLDPSRADIESYAGLSPIDATDENLAPSAYMVVRLKTVGTQGNLAQRGRDMLAVKTGAASKGLNSFGIVNSAATNVPDCGGLSAVVWWDTTADGCLNATQLTTMGMTLNDGDIVVATWLAQPPNLAANDVVYRYPQPNQPTLNQMEVDLAMGDNNLTGAGLVQTANANITDAATIGTDLAVQGTSTLTGNVTAGSDLSVGSNFGNPDLNVPHGNVTVGQNVAVAGTATASQTLSARNNLSATTTLETPSINANTTINNNFNVVNIANAPTLTVNKEGTKLEAAGLALFTGDMNITLVSAGDVTTTGSLTTGNMNVSGNAATQMHDTNASGVCSGKACPDNVDNNPTMGGL